MTMNHDEFIAKQIKGLLLEAHFDESIANSSGSAAADHKRSNPRITDKELLDWAKKHARQQSRIKGKPAIPRFESRPLYRSKWRS